MLPLHPQQTGLAYSYDRRQWWLLGFEKAIASTLILMKRKTPAVMCFSQSTVCFQSSSLPVFMESLNEIFAVEPV